MTEADVSALIAQIKELEAENAQLRTILASHNIECVFREPQEDFQQEKPSSSQCLTTKLSLQEKVSLFRSVFKGREDVFARRWYSATTQKSGYQPAANENGIVNSVINESSNVPSVPIASSLRFLTMTSTNILQVRISTVET